MDSVDPVMETGLDSFWLPAEGILRPWKMERMRDCPDCVNAAHGLIFFARRSIFVTIFSQDFFDHCLKIKFRVFSCRISQRFLLSSRWQGGGAVM
jgi:hypothetical protein